MVNFLWTKRWPYKRARLYHTNNMASFSITLLSNHWCEQKCAVCENQSKFWTLLWTCKEKDRRIFLLHGLSMSIHFRMHFPCLHDAFTRMDHKVPDYVQLHKRNWAFAAYLWWRIYALLRPKWGIYSSRVVCRGLWWQNKRAMALETCGDKGYEK